MCGITGILSSAPGDHADALIRMTRAITHRGPDDFGYIALDPGAAVRRNDLHALPPGKAHAFLGHRRLSIIDITGTAQPLSNETGTVWTVFNGEIYNYPDLADTLKAKGHHLKNRGDTEVLVHLWEDHGPAMVDHLVGMFAFAIVDTARNTLFLARDRFGQKPLYYFQGRDFFAFASELQAFFELPGFRRQAMDPVAMAQYFRYGYIPHPRTAYQNTAALPPGSCLLRKNEHQTITRYWKPDVTGQERRVDEDLLQAELDGSVKLRLRTDVPLGMFLSGGIDSALVTASAAEQLPAPPKTFTISTGESWCDESREAAITAGHLQTDHQTLMVTPDLVGISARLARHYGQPFADFSAIPTYFISEATRRHVTVVLTGDGGDELFAGYGHYLNRRLYSAWGMVPDGLKRLLAAILRTLPGKRPPQVADAILSAYAIPRKGENNTPLFHQAWRDRGFSSDFSAALSSSVQTDVDAFSRYFQAAGSHDPIDRWLEADQRLYLCDDILTKVDIASMAVSLECRAPFLDHRLAAYANSLSSRLKLQGETTKAVLKTLAARRLPGAILNLPKKGFTLPLGDWLRGGLKEWAHAAIFDDPAIWTPYLKPSFVRRLWHSHQRGRYNHEARLWIIMALCLWHKSFAQRIST